MTLQPEVQDDPAVVADLVELDADARKLAGTFRRINATLNAAIKAGYNGEGRTPDIAHGLSPVQFCEEFAVHLAVLGLGDVVANRVAASRARQTLAYSPAPAPAAFVERWTKRVRQFIAA